uniref:Uncharacterized protein n=1 Tax=Arundo donax TaxID=35708 RepID=A0A0A8ZGT1_ARUDO
MSIFRTSFAYAQTSPQYQFVQPWLVDQLSVCPTLVSMISASDRTFRALYP